MSFISGDTRGCFPGKCLSFALLELPEMHQFTKNQAHFTPSMEGEGRNFTIISTSDGQNSRVTFQKSANV